jgi:hypothetical protein
MTPDLQGYAGHYTLGSLAPRLLGQCSLGSPGSPPPRQRSHTGSGPLSATCSPISTDPSPLLSIDFSCGPLSVPLCSYIALCFRLLAQSAAACSRWFLARRFFCPEDGGDTSLRNVRSYKIYTALHPRRRHSS